MTASAMAPIGYGKGAEPNSIKQEPGSNGRGEATAVPRSPRHLTVTEVTRRWEAR